MRHCNECSGLPSWRLSCSYGRKSNVTSRWFSASASQETEGWPLAEETRQPHRHGEFCQGGMPLASIWSAIRGHQTDIGELHRPNRNATKTCIFAEICAFKDILLAPGVESNPRSRSSKVQWQLARATVELQPATSAILCRPGSLEAANEVCTDVFSNHHLRHTFTSSQRPMVIP